MEVTLLLRVKSFDIFFFFLNNPIIFLKNNAERENVKYTRKMLMFHTHTMFDINILTYINIYKHF